MGQNGFVDNRLSDAATVGLLLLLCATTALGGTDTTFSSVLTPITNWVTGSYGKLVAIGALATGLAVALVKQQLMFIPVAVGIAATAAYGPGILTNVVSAAL